MAKAPKAYMASKDNTVVMPLPEPDILPAVTIYCAECVNWKMLTAQASFGHCMLSAKALPGPITTTDMMTCSKAVAIAS